MPNAAPGWEMGRVQVYTGDGKGKTTAALGLALRAAGAGLRVFIAQFLKCRPSCEREALSLLGARVTLRCYGRPNFVIGAPAPADFEAARHGLAEARAALTGGDYRLVILDEANVAARLGLFTVDNLLDLLDVRPPRVELVLTGRDADPRVLARADLITEMRSVRHYHAAGQTARRGIEE